MLQSSHDCNARRINETSIMIDDVHIGAEGETLESCNNT